MDSMSRQFCFCSTCRRRCRRRSMICSVRMTILEVFWRRLKTQTFFLRSFKMLLVALAMLAAQSCAILTPVSSINVTAYLGACMACLP